MAQLDWPSLNILFESYMYKYNTVKGLDTVLLGFVVYSQEDFILADPISVLEMYSMKRLYINLHALSF